MCRNGISSYGIQRWICCNCGTTTTKKRVDVTARNRRSLFLRWLLGNESLPVLAHYARRSKRTLIRQFTVCWLQKPPQPRSVDIDERILIIDAIYLQGRIEAVLIGRTLTKVVYWSFAHYENYESWKEFLQQVNVPSAIVCDGRKGLLQAVREVYPHARIQRCIAHVMRYGLSLLTTRPKTEAGKELRNIVCKLGAVRTRRQKRKWLRMYFNWKKNYHSFLNQKTYETHFKKKRWWYTHRKLRSASQLILHALPELFTYIGHYHIPRTSNHVEGGINARLKELLHRHRGLPLSKKKVLVSLYLLSRQKSTKNVT